MNTDAAFLTFFRRLSLPQRRRNRRGFTLLELLTVVTMVGILSSVAIPNFLNSTDRSRYAQASGDMGRMKTALNEFFENNSNFPGDVDNGQVPAGIANGYLRDWPTSGPFGATYDYDSYNSGTGSCYIQIVFRGKNAARDVPNNQVLFVKPGMYRQSNQSLFNMVDDQVLSMGVTPGSCRPSGT
ncbi:MAG: prepilin-type N-terminal cleavage/methylation domain-containing protein [Anaerolineae bacterium]|nr:prepilin-type N-terminal cleavage/methylation domain-containing protein [Gloeobacterales cyanobacterium ES-bin-313]